MVLDTRRKHLFKVVANTIYLTIVADTSYSSSDLVNQTAAYRDYHQDFAAMPKTKKRKLNKGDAPPASPPSLNSTGRRAVG